MKNKYIFFFFCLFAQGIFAQSPQECYSEAFSEITSMLSGKDTLDFRNAVYTAENAYFDNQLDKDVFNGAISFYAALSKNIMSSGDIIYSEKDKEKASMQCAVFTFMTDSIPVSLNGGIAIHPPFSYNHEDFAGQKDWTNTFVSTLMQTQKGNCHSLPYLYKMIMDELVQESFLALAPNHIYIKAQNKAVGWYNIELTCGDFPTDAWLMASGYIHTDAIRSGIYMNPLTTKQSVALCLVDLAQGYQAKFGIEDGTFILQCCNTALQYFPNYINALLLKTETLTALYRQSTDSEKGKELLSQITEITPLIHQLGYRKMPQGMYQNWLKSLNTEDTNQKMKAVVIKK